MPWSWDGDNMTDTNLTDAEYLELVLGAQHMGLKVSSSRFWELNMWDSRWVAQVYENSIYGTQGGQLKVMRTPYMGLKVGSSSLWELHIWDSRWVAQGYENSIYGTQGGQPSVSKTSNSFKWMLLYDNVCLLQCLSKFSSLNVNVVWTRTILKLGRTRKDTNLSRNYGKHIWFYIGQKNE